MIRVFLREKSLHLILHCPPCMFGSADLSPSSRSSASHGMGADGAKHTTRMLQVLKVSGEDLTTIPAEELSDVLSLKLCLQPLCGVPRFRQRLLRDCDILEDDALLDASIPVQLVLLAFVSASNEEVDQLSAASRAGRAKEVEEALLRPQDPDLRLPDGSAALHSAAKAGHEDIVRLLLEGGAEKDSRNNRGETPLFVAARKFRVDSARALLEAMANPNARDNRGETPLCVVARKGHVHGFPLGHARIGHLLLQMGADPDSACSVGRTPLWWACLRGDMDIAVMLLQANLKSQPDPEPRSKCNGGCLICLMLS